MSDSIASGRGPSPREGAPRRPYRRPRLERLGTLTEITASISASGKKNDHGSRPFNKT
jgi:hypothetical protein